MYYLARSGTEVPPFPAADASTHIFEFLSDRNFQGFYDEPKLTGPGGTILNWTMFCDIPKGVFLGSGGFLGYLLSQRHAQRPQRHLTRQPL